MYRYEAISVYYRDGKLTNGYLTITHHADGQKDPFHLEVTLTKPKEIMNTLRQIEKEAGHAAELEEGTVYGLFGKPSKTFCKWVSVMRFK